MEKIPHLLLKKEEQQPQYAFKNHFNARQFPKDGEIKTANEPSMTIPDDTLSIRQIMERHAQGLPTTGTRVPMYDEEDDLPDPRRLDLAEKQELQELFAEELQEIQAREEERTKPKSKKELQQPDPKKEEETPTKENKDE